MKFIDGVYISVKMNEITEKHLREYIKDYLPYIEIVPDFHCTLIFSKKEFEGEIESKEYTAEAKFKHFSKFGEDKEALVAEIDCQVLIDRNKELMEMYGFISDFPLYKPHFSLSYKAYDVNLASLPPIDFPIIFENETIEPLNLEYAN